MILGIRNPLFAWDAMQASPSLGTIRHALEAIPDGPLLAALHARRHNGLRHLPRPHANAALRLLIGIESEDAVPQGI